MKKIALVTLACSLFLTSCGHMGKKGCRNKESYSKESCNKDKKDCGGDSCHKKTEEKKS